METLPYFIIIMQTITIRNHPECACFQEYYKWMDELEEAESDEEYDRLKDKPFVLSDSIFHTEEKYHTQRAWDIACEIFESAAKKGLKGLNLGSVMDRNDFMALNTLPRSIGELKDLERLVIEHSS